MIESRSQPHVSEFINYKEQKWLGWFGLLSEWQLSNWHKRYCLLVYNMQIFISLEKVFMQI